MEVENTAPKGTTVDQAASKIAALFKPPEQNAESTEEVGHVAPEATTAEAETESEAQPEVQLVKVKVDGEELEVPFDEVLKGYSRTADYTKKTQQVAEVRKKAEEEAETARAARQQYLEGLEYLKSQLVTDKEPDWEELRKNDPIEFVTQRELHRERKEKLAALEAEKQRVLTHQQQEQAKYLEKHIQTEQEKLLQALPEWKDASKAKAEKEMIAEYAKSLGFSEQELSSLYDHRAVVALRKAALYDKMVNEAQSKKETAKSSPQTAKPGNLKPSIKSKEYAAARNQLAKSGKVDDFAVAFKQLFAKGN